MKNLTIKSLTISIFAMALLLEPGSNANLAQAQNKLESPPDWTQSGAGAISYWTRGASKIKLTAPTQTSDVEAFFKSQIANDAKYRGPLRKRGEIQSTDNGGFSTIYQFATSVVAYGAFKRGDGVRFLALAAPDIQTLQNDLPALQNIAMQLRRGAATQPRPTSAATQKGASNAKTTYQGVTGKKYLSPSQIVGVYLDENYTFGVGGLMIMQFDPVMILRDGTAYEGFEVPPTELNVTSFKKARPSRVGKWKKTATGFSVLFNGDKTASEIKASFKVKPASANQKLSGTYETIGGGGNTAMGGDSIVAYSNSYTFMPDGRFSGEKFGGGSNAGVTVSSNSKNAGRYTVSGYTLRLQYNDGRVVRRLFYFYPDKDRADKSVIGIGDSAYIQQ